MPVSRFRCCWTVIKLAVSLLLLLQNLPPAFSCCCSALVEFRAWLGAADCGFWMHGLSQCICFQVFWLGMRAGSQD